MGRDIAPTTMGFGLRGQPLSFSARMEKHGHKSMTTTRELQSTMRDHIRRTIAFIQRVRGFPTHFAALGLFQTGETLASRVHAGLH
jgi:hypothetical protein